MHPLNDALPGQYMPVQVTHSSLATHQLMRRLAVEPRSTAGLLLPSRCPCGMILLIPYLLVWDWRISRAEGKCFFICLGCSITTIVFYYFSLSLLSVYRLELWGWGLQTDWVYRKPSITLLWLARLRLWQSNYLWPWPNWHEAKLRLSL